MRKTAQRPLQNSCVKTALAILTQTLLRSEQVKSAMVWYAKCNRKYAKWNRKYAKLAMQNAIENMQNAIQNMQYKICNTQYAGAPRYRTAVTTAAIAMQRCFGFHRLLHLITKAYVFTNWCTIWGRSTFVLLSIWRPLAWASDLSLQIQLQKITRIFAWN